jgi:predicted nucleic acid-binding protein
MIQVAPRTSVTGGTGLGYRAGRLERALSAKGQRLGENDNWIAATALYYGEPIVTNDNDFARVVRAGLPLKLLRY